MSTEQSSYINTENEKISISRILNPINKYFGTYFINIHDDPEVSNTIAPHTLDIGTIDYLVDELINIKAKLLQKKER